MDNIKMSRLLDCYGAFLTSSSRNVLEQYINDDYSLSEIAERENISRQGVRDGIQRAKNTLTDMEEKLLVVDRTDRILSKLLKLEESLKASGCYDEYALLIDELKNICEEYYGI